MSDDQPTTDEIQRLTGPGTIISLVLAVGLVVGVIIAARIAYDHAEHQPVTLNTIDAPGASSKECNSLINNLPDHVGSYDRVSLANPAPDGAAVWIDGDNRITLRCGVQPPDSYTELSTTEEHGKDESGGQLEGIRWLGIADARGGNKPVTDSVTWYTLGRAQEVAVTGPEDVADDLSDLSGALHHNPVSDASATARPAQTPLSTLPVTDEAARGKQCRSVLDALPDHFGTLQRTTKDALGNDLPDGMAAWTAPRRDPVVVRCGVQQPESYHAGAQLQQINDVPWFSDGTPGNQPEAEDSSGDSTDSSAQNAPENASTSATDNTWYALGYSDIIALSMPASSGNSVITTLSNAISKNMEKSGD